ncbi:Cutinase transcription factor 1 alpha [Vanrija pseudolonga]|uniref:Cutinase transcription factor 1 alpha n=1 Tax=Vanrija pseudolonga TaxID=143232 RepID=A0AAF1BIX0_9TREE|nr:Cutinase transcription factor 1 alpha [Vanrija pseudolonga]
MSRPNLAGPSQPPLAPPPPPSSIPSAAPPKAKRPRQSGPDSAAAAKATPSVMRASTSANPGPGDLSKVRAFAACRACRQKKIKCLPGPAAATAAGGTAACQQCTQSGTECEYQPTRDRAAYSRAYVQDLSGRVQALEALHARLLPLLSAYEGGSLPSLPVSTPKKWDAGNRSGVESAIGSAMHSPRSPRSDGGDSGEGEVMMMADERGNFRYIGSSNTLSLIDSFGGHQEGQHPALHRESLDGIEPKPNRGSPENHPYFGAVAGAGSIGSVFPGLEEAIFPPRADAEKMIDAYFVEVHPVLPVVNEHDFRRDFNTLMDKVEVGDFSGLSGGFMSVVFAMFALGERVIVVGRAYRRECTKLREGRADDDTLLPGEAEAGVIWFERSQVLHFSTIREIDIHQVQCLTLQASFQAAVNAMPMSWLLASQALRIAMDIGLHRAAPRFKVSYAIKQLGSRCWWAIYGLERLISITLGRPLGCDDRDVDVAYPVEIDDAALHALGDTQAEDVGDIPPEPQESTMSGFVALTKLCKIAGRVSQVLYRPLNGRSVNDPSWATSQQKTFDKLDKMLRDWLEHEVPKKYKDPSPSRPVSLMSAVLSNAYFAVLITLHRNLLPSNPDFPRPKPVASSQSLAHCVDAARSVIHVAAQSRVMVPVSHHIAVFCQYLWSSSVILLLCEVRAKDQVVVDAVGAQIDSCRSSLRTLEPAWPGCRKLRELLGDVENRAKEVRAGLGRPAATNKKRKSSSADSQDAKARRQSKASNASASGATVVPGEWKHPSSIRERSYETSDARTPLQPPATHFSTPAVPEHVAGGIDMPLPTFDLFDVGDMNFDGLEMLSGFTSNDPWNGETALAVPPQQTPQSQGGQGNHVSPNGPRMSFASAGSSGPTPPMSSMINTTTPSPSVSTGTAPAQNQPSWFNGATLDQAQTPTVEISEMWAQIAGTSFDWEADPTVPFNI